MKTDITTRSDFDVVLMDCMGSDESITRAAKVSTIGAESEHADASRGLIRFLLSNRHGTPFEHASMTFRITAPIFVWREFHRHRIGFSYNEESGRYKQLDPVFYVVPPERALVQHGKPGHYTYVAGDEEQYSETVRFHTLAYQHCYDTYELLLEKNIAKEVARMCLPVSIYSTCYVTCNPRSLMAFLSLRTKHPESLFPSFPMDEINRVATAMEGIFADKFPWTWEAFADAKRVSP